MPSAHWRAPWPSPAPGTEPRLLVAPVQPRPATMVARTSPAWWRPTRWRSTSTGDRLDHGVVGPRPVGGMSSMRSGGTIARDHPGIGGAKESTMLAAKLCQRSRGLSYGCNRLTIAAGLSSAMQSEPRMPTLVPLKWTHFSSVRTWRRRPRQIDMTDGIRAIKGGGHEEFARSHLKKGGRHCLTRPPSLILG